MWFLCFSRIQRTNGLTTLVNLAPIHIEIAVLRLHRFSKIVQEPKHHEIYLAAMFDDMINIPNRYPNRNHPHFQRLRNDLRLLQFIEGLAEYVDVIVSDPLVLFSDEFLGGEFVKSDFNMIKNRFIIKAIPLSREIIDPP